MSTIQGITVDYGTSTSTTDLFDPCMSHMKLLYREFAGKMLLGDGVGQLSPVLTDTYIRKLGSIFKRFQSFFFGLKEDLYNIDKEVVIRLEMVLQKKI